MTKDNGASSLPAVTDPGLLDRISKGTPSKKPMRAIPIERLERWAKWWEWRTMGLTIRNIIEREEKAGFTFTHRQVRHAFNQFVERCGESASRGVRLEVRKATGELAKRTAFQRIARLQDEDKKNEGRGIRMVETTTTRGPATNTDPLGPLLDTKVKVSFVRIDTEMRNWIRTIVDADKYIATLDGLMSLRDTHETPSEFVLDLGSFFDNAPMGPVDVDAEAVTQVEVLPPNGTGESNGDRS